MERQFVVRDEVAGLVRAAFGGARRPVDSARLTGGTKKGVYRLTLDDGTTTILYVWSADENYWPGPDESTDPFANPNGADLFEAATARLNAVGVRTPAIRLIDRSRIRYPADVALVEDVRGGTLEALLERDPAAAAAPLAALAGYLDAMAGARGPHIGKVAEVERGEAPQDRPTERVVLDRALGHLTAVAGRVPALARVRSRVEDLLREQAAALRPRRDYGLVHGELGPDHVFLDDRGAPVLIDVEGTMFFDVEWEHAFLRLRFGPHYAALRLPGLDGARLEFYALCQSLSLIEGPLRIADGDFPDRDFMLGIARWHTEAVLAAAGD